jgi:flagellar basal-body rod modification protein FlgD
MVSAASAMPATLTTLPFGSQTPSTSGSSQVLNQSDFLQLMTAQLQKQDPLNPLTGTQFASELAEFTTAQGVQGLQSGITGMSGAMAGMQATGLVGRSVAVAGNALALSGSGGVAGAINLSAGASDVKVTIADATGKVVATLDLGGLPAGMQPFVWNGTTSAGSQAPPGNYSFSVSAIGATGGAVTAAPYAVLPVTAVALGGQGGPMLDLAGGAAPVALSAVQQIF